MSSKKDLGSSNDGVVPGRVERSQPRNQRTRSLSEGPSLRITLCIKTWVEVGVPFSGSADAARVIAISLASVAVTGDAIDGAGALDWHDVRIPKSSKDRLRTIHRRRGSSLGSKDIESKEAGPRWEELQLGLGVRAPVIRVHSRLQKLATVASVFLKGLPHRRERSSYAQQQHNRYGQNHDNWTPDSELLLPAQLAIDADEKPSFVRPEYPHFRRSPTSEGPRCSTWKEKITLGHSRIALPRVPLVAGLLVLNRSKRPQCTLSDSQNSRDAPEGDLGGARVD